MKESLKTCIENITFLSNKYKIIIYPEKGDSWYVGNIPKSFN